MILSDISLGMYVQGVPTSSRPPFKRILGPFLGHIFFVILDNFKNIFGQFLKKAEFFGSPCICERQIAINLKIAHFVPRLLVKRRRTSSHQKIDFKSASKLSSFFL